MKFRYALYFFILLLSIGIAGIPLHLENSYKRPNFISITEVKDVFAHTGIITTDMVKLSPSKEFYAFASFSDLAMNSSGIWIVKPDGSGLEELVAEETIRYITNPVWSPDSSKLAFIQIYPMELKTVDIKSGEVEVLYSEFEHEEDSVLNPSIGHLGKTFLKWDGDEILFEDSKALPTNIMAVNVTTGDVRTVERKSNSGTVAGVTSFSSFHQSQRDTEWGNHKLGECDETIHSAGCAVSAIASMLKMFDEDIDAAELNTWLSDEGARGYLNGCDVRWNIIPNVASSISLKGAYFGESSMERLDHELQNGNGVIIGYNSVNFTDIPHWVLVVRKTEGDYIISDPWKVESSPSLLSEYGSFNHMIVYERN